MENLKTKTDEELVALYVSEVDEAFDVLLERYKNKLYTYLLSYTKHQDVADDLFQETFVKAIMHIRNGRYVNCGKFYAWLTRIAHNLVIDQFRNEQSGNSISCEDSESLLADDAHPCEYGAESEIVTEQTLEDIRQLIGRLPENQREVIRMRYYQDLSFKEISAQTGVSINTALGRMRYALINMRRMAHENHLYPTWR